jgi:hypothetical protein
MRAKDQEDHCPGATLLGPFDQNHDFQLDVLEKLGRLEAKVNMLVGNGQPGRMKLAEDRIVALERNDVKRNVYDRIVTAVIAFAVSALIALHDRFLPK